VSEDSEMKNEKLGIESLAHRPQVSIGMPVYNGEKYIAHTLDTLLAQTLSDFELIISDNGSTDRTETICREYALKDSRIRYIRHAVNRGAAWNWNHVVHQARGVFLKWASSNDYYDAKMLERCTAVLLNDNSIALCYPLTWMVDEDGTRKVYTGDIDVLEDTPSQRFIHIRQHLSMNNAQAGVIRLSALRRTRLERSYPHSDMILMAELALYGKYRLLPEPLFFRRTDKPFMSHKLSPEDLVHFIDPTRHPRFTMISLSRHIDSIWSVLRAGIGVKETFAALRYIAQRAYRERRAVYRELAILVGIRRPSRALPGR
jgi:glycosyltransferase involved in cell wall biosynthesis